jgi:Ca2+-binding EF-hand superfamily protein
MTDVVINLLQHKENVDVAKLFEEIKGRLFMDYDKNQKGYLLKKELKRPLSMISKNVFGSRFDNESFESLLEYFGLTTKNKIEIEDFDMVADHLLISLLIELQKNDPNKHVEIVIDNE